jgi:hypothetical protein
VQLGDAETGLLEDCHEDWRALWEIVSIAPTRSVDESIAFLSPLVAGGYLTTLAVTTWEQAAAATPMAIEDALAAIIDPANYVPHKENATFYLLSITARGEAAIPPGAFPAH